MGELTVQKELQLFPAFAGVFLRRSWFARHHLSLPPQQRGVFPSSTIRNAPISCLPRASMGVSPVSYLRLVNTWSSPALARVFPKPILRLPIDNHLLRASAGASYALYGNMSEHVVFLASAGVFLGVLQKCLQPCFFSALPSPRQVRVLPQPRRLGLAWLCLLPHYRGA